MKKFYFLLLVPLFICCKEPTSNKAEGEYPAPPAADTTTVQSHQITEEDFHNTSEYDVPEKEEPVEKPVDTVLANKLHDQALALLIEKRDLQTANDLIHKAIEYNPNNADSYYVLGNIYQLQGLNMPALEALKMAININPRHVDAIMKSAIIYGKAGDMINCCAQFKRACELGDQNGCIGVTKACKQ